MAAASSLTPEYSVSDHPLIRGFFDKSKAIKMTQITLAIKTIAEFGESLKGIRGLDPISTRRFEHIGDRLIYAIKEAKKGDQLYAIQSLIVECANLKNSLQVEMIFFGGVAPTIIKFSEMLRLPYLAELVDLLPLIFSKISFSPGDLSYFKVETSILTQFLESVGMDQLTDEFDVAFFNLLSVYEWKDGFLLIPFNKLPARDFLLEAMERKGLYTKLIIQILYLCSLERQILVESVSARMMNDGLIDLLQEGNFDGYLDHENLMPFFVQLLIEIKKAKTKKIDLTEIYLQKDFIKKFDAIIHPSWKEELASVYEVVKKIDLLARKVFSIKLISELDELLNRQACDGHVISWAEHLHAVCRSFDFLRPYPIDRHHPFCHSKEEFLGLLPATFEKKPEKDVTKKALKAKKPEKKPQTKPHVTEQVLQEKSDLAAAAQEVEESISSVKPSLDGTKKFIETLFIHPRVDAWRVSPEAGLEYYARSGKPCQNRSVEQEMIARHRFPDHLFLLAFNPLFSKKSSILRENGEQHEHFRSVLMIDSKKYILESTIDARGVLYHFYAKPVTQFHHYFELTKDSSSEFPQLGRATPSPKFERLNLEGVDFDEKNHAIFSFEGKRYKVLFLGENG